MNVLKITFLFLAVWFSIINVGKIIYKDEVGAFNILIWAIGIVGFIALQFNLI